jgi:2-hydroxychromene-2-carboxylate isomerase
VPTLPTVGATAAGKRDEQPVFYYDLGDPMCYMAAEQILSALPVVTEWEPVLASELNEDGGVTPDVAELERRARSLGLQALRWPETWPPDTRQAMLAATYAKRIGRGVAFSLAAFRQAFAAGRDLTDRDTILIAGAACEMHPSALLNGMATRSVAQALAAANTKARNAGVSALPAVKASDRVFCGEGAIARAGAALR